MPRNACRECRVRKVKCLVGESDVACSRCLTRNIRCSYANEPRSHTQSGEVSNATTLESPKDRNGYELETNIGCLDVGHGSPPEMLREQELTQSLLLLYFSNFGDIHFMFDQDLFMRQFALGEAPKMVLYAMMALGIKYSQAPFRDSLSRAHRGEQLFRYARDLLKTEFDYTSLTTARTYILLSTYHLTFGGARKAWWYLSSAYSIVTALRLMEEPLEIDPRQAQLSRQLMGTIMLMDRTLSPSIRLNSIVPNDDYISLMHSTRSGPVFQHLVYLSTLYNQVCSYYRYGRGDLQHQRSVLEHWSKELPQQLRCTTQRLETCQNYIELRQLVFLQTLLHHTHQLSLFPALRNGSIGGTDCQACYDHASTLVGLVEWFWNHTGTDLHNAIVGQCLTIAAVVHTHSLLTASTFQAMKASQDKISCVRRCFDRIKQHTRIFNPTFNQLETFLKICSVDCSARLFDQNTALLNQMLHLGTHFENLDYRTGGRLDGLNNLIVRNQDIYSQYMNGDPMKLLSPEFLTDRMNSLSSEREVAQQPTFNFDDYALIFADMAVPDILPMTFG